MGVLFAQAQQQAHGAEVRAKVEKVLRGDLAGHDALLDAAAGEGGDHLRELADLEPDDFVHQRGEGRIGLAFEGDRDEAFYPLAAGFLGEEQRQRPVAGDDAQGLNVDGHGGDSYRNSAESQSDPAGEFLGGVGPDFGEGGMVVRHGGEFDGRSCACAWRR